MKIGVISLFPKAIESYKDPELYGLTAKAFKGRVELFVEDLRLHGQGRHQTVDDSPYGGGDGMVLKPEPVEAALKALVQKMDTKREKVRAYYMSPAGKLWTQAKAERLVCKVKDSEIEGLVLLSGRYGGVDQRAVDELFDGEISMGPFVLNGGELPALSLIESLLRLLPGVLGNETSFKEDSFSKTMGLEAPSYTRPQFWRGREVPSILLSGNHKEIESYKSKVSEKRSERWLNQALEALKSLFN